MCTYNVLLSTVWLGPRLSQLGLVKGETLVKIEQFAPFESRKL